MGPRMLVAAAVTGLWLLPQSVAAQLTGRYLGSYQVYEAAGGDDSMRHLLDLHAQDDLSREIQLRLDASLGYRFRPGTSNTDLFQSRLYGMLRSPWWRSYAQFVPWQAAAPGVNPPQRREFQLGLDLTPRRSPALRLNYDRRDRITSLGRSSTDSFRAGTSYAVTGMATHLDYRMIRSRSDQGFAAPTDTDEWKAGITGTRRWRSLSGTAGYEAEMTTFDSRERERRYYTQRLDVTGQWQAASRVRVGASAFTRWGRSEDNSARGDQTIDEDFLSASVSYRPIQELDLQAIREYRSAQAYSGDTVSDYLRLQAIFRKDLLHGLLFQNGYSYTQDLQSKDGSLPRNSIYFLLDGRVRRGVGMRGELRFAVDPGQTRSTSAFVRRLLGIRLAPSGSTRAEVTWTLDTFPEVSIPAEVDSLPPTRLASQSDRLWEVLLGWQPSPRTDLSASLRSLDGSGRTDRSDRVTSFTGGMGFARRSRIGLTGSRKTSRLSGREFVDNAITADLSFWFPGEFRTKVSWTRSGTGTARDADSYNVILEKTF